MSASPIVTYSLRRRLLVALTLLSFVFWLVVALSSYLRAHHEADEIFDAQLAEMAQALLVIADTGRVPGNPLTMPVPAHRYQQKILFQIWSSQGEKTVLLVRSDNAPLQPLSDEDGFSEREWNGEFWRFFSQTDAAPMAVRHRVQVAQSHAIRDELAQDIAIRQLLPLLVGLPLFGIVIWLVIGGAMKPLSTLVDQLRQYQPYRLKPIAATSPMPEEVAPLVLAINDLFRRVGEAMARERNFTADAAHELRTPLAALKVQAQVAQRAGSGDQGAGAPALNQVLVGVSRMEHLVEQLMTLARLDPEADTLHKEAVSLSALAAEVAALAASEAIAKGQQLALMAQDDESSVKANPGLLQILLRNLVENAIRYTPAGGRIEILVNGGAVSVRDTGPGIPPQERERVLDRFYRMADTSMLSGTQGAGLGLSIVSRIVELHGASFNLREHPGGGLWVEVVFPR